MTWTRPGALPFADGRGSPLVGRDAEITALRRLLKAADAGDGAALFVVGEPGIGKSRLAAEAAALARRFGIRVLRGRATRSGANTLRPFGEALLGLAREGWAPPEELGPYLAVLGRLVPDWRLDGASPAPVPAFVYGEAVLRVLNASGSGSVLLVLEDLHDADPDTIAVLEYLVDNIEGQPLAVVGTLRDGPSPALELAEYARRGDSRAVLALPRLGEKSVAELCAGLLDTDPQLLPAELCAALFRDSAGNPLIAAEMVREQVDDAALVLRAGTWVLVGPNRGRAPRGLARDVADRVRGADPSARRMIEAAAVLGGQFPVDVLGAAAQISARDLPRALAAAVREQFLVPADRPGWFALRHPMLEQAVRDHLTPPVRHSLALAAARALEERFPDPAEDWTLRAAELRASAGDLAGAEELFAAAGRRALRTGSPAFAVDSLLRARRCQAPDVSGERWAELLCCLVTALGALGRHREALEYAAEVDAAGEGRLTPRALADLHIAFARVALRACWFVRALPHIRLARAALGDLPDVARYARLDMAEASVVLETPGPRNAATAEALAARAVDRAHRADLPAVEAEALLMLGRCRRNSRPDGALDCYRRAHRIARTHDLPEPRLEAQLMIGAHEWMFHAEPAGLVAAGTEASAQGAVIETRHVQLSLAVDALFRGRFAESESLLAAAWEDLARLRLTGLGSYALAIRALIYAYRGRDADLAAARAEFDAWRGNRDDEIPLAHGLARGVCALLHGDPDAARGHFDALPDPDAGQGAKYLLCGQYGLGVLLRAAHGSAGWDEHRGALSRPAGRLPWNAQFLWLAQALLAGRDGDRPGAEAALAEFLRISAVFPPARHLALHLVAADAARDGWGDPAGWLREAEAYYSENEILTAARHCRAALRGLGEPTRQRRQGSRNVPGPLWSLGVTVREYEVLREVAKRRTNREIAAELHLSHRTVERHVANLLAKTGARNRRDLGALISAAEVPR